MAAVDPAKVHIIAMAIVSSAMSCLVALKDKNMALVTQGMDVGQQVSTHVRV
eukprot:CAMPEP_0116924200 /NCGR_PEP_ID=MMETSP0467-20121206/23353_1 /TAXON_ID=283647 /ORGANISM="Mesodinium pulex, Strain SPMC105" /LENGTH=51 /DNA_ID=CAMNT_0004602951 /DNA_START=612 /DNA_END=767 /DNA_ORIENTATION=-